MDCCCGTRTINSRWQRSRNIEFRANINLINHLAWIRKACCFCYWHKVCICLFIRLFACSCVRLFVRFFVVLLVWIRCYFVSRCLYFILCCCCYCRCVLGVSVGRKCSQMATVISSTIATRKYLLYFASCVHVVTETNLLDVEGSLQTAFCTVAV
jgi:hypothetical protein